MVLKVFKDAKYKLHHFSLCQGECDKVKDEQETSKKKHRFKHKMLMEKECYSEETGMWWLVYEDHKGMFCLICNLHISAGDQEVYIKTPATRYRKEAIIDHSKSKSHRAAELQENIQRVSPFNKEVVH